MPFSTLMIEMSNVPPPRSNTAMMRRPSAAAMRAVRERGRGRLVEDAHDVEARDLAGVARGLALRVVEVRRHRDDGARDRLAERFFGDLAHPAQHVRGDSPAG